MRKYLSQFWDTTMCGWMCGCFLFPSHAVQEEMRWTLLECRYVLGTVLAAISFTPNVPGTQSPLVEKGQSSPLKKACSEQRKSLWFDMPCNSEGSGPDLREARPSLNCVRNYSPPQPVATSELFLTDDPTPEHVRGFHHLTISRCPQILAPLWPCLSHHPVCIHVLLLL